MTLKKEKPSEKAKTDSEDSFEVISPNESSDADQLRFDEYVPRINWEINKGMNFMRMHKLYSLFTEDKSAFKLRNIIPKGFNSSNGTFTFGSTSNNNKVVLFVPKPRTITYTISESKNKGTGELSGDMIEMLAHINGICKNMDSPTRFVSPIKEEPYDLKKGEQHIVLLVIDYDPKQDVLSPIILDSIGRNTYGEALSSYWKSQSTGDTVLKEYLKKNATPEIKTEELQRISYNHQNRAIEGNCGSYTFVCLFHAMNSFITGEIMDDLVHSIPEPGFIVSNSFLKTELIEEIESCVNFRSLTRDSINDSLAKGTSSKANYDQLQEFVDTLESYLIIRESEGENLAVSFFSHSSYSKTAATKLLLDFLIAIQKRGKFDQEICQNIIDGKLVLLSGRLGKAIEFHLKKLNYSTLDELIKSHQSLEQDDYAMA